VSRPPRLIDLHVPWPWQYARESTDFHGEFYEDIPARLGQLDGYLGATRAAFVAIRRRPDDWARQADPWRALLDLIARVEAEFCGRVLAVPDDHARWQADADGLCWAVLCVSAPPNVAPPARFAELFRRGVRVFGLGEAVALDPRALPALADLADAGGSRPVADLAGLAPPDLAAALAWFEADPARAERVLPLVSHGIASDFADPGDPGLPARLRALGASIGLTPGAPGFESAEALRATIEQLAALPFRGQSGFDGIGFGTNFPALEAPLPGLGTSEQIAAWAASTFDPPGADALLEGGAARLVGRMLGRPA
jgi:membrane dipeptidase